jgi:uncharacterized protein with GYD domain
MARFATTIRFTPQGIGAIQDTTRRAAAFKAAAKKLGIKVVDLYWSLGPFDGLIIFDAADSQVATAAMLHLASQGNVQTQTAEIFTAADMDKILDRLRK